MVQDIWIFSSSQLFYRTPEFEEIEVFTFRQVSLPPASICDLGALMALSGSYIPFSFFDLLTSRE